MQRNQVRTGPDLGTLACACSSLSRPDAKWEHFNCQPWIPVGDEYLSLISIENNTTPPGSLAPSVSCTISIHPDLRYCCLVTPLAHNITARPH